MIFRILFLISALSVAALVYYMHHLSDDSVTHYEAEEKKPLKLIVHLGFNRTLNVRQCGTCVAHTSSGRMINSSLGAYIDSFDCVIRMNDQPYGDRDVGNKTTHRVVNFFFKNIMEAESELIIWTPELHRLVLEKRFRGKATILDLETMTFIHRMYKQHVGGKHWLSTGFFTFWISSMFCNELTMIGFDSKCKPGVPYHYYGSPKRVECEERHKYDKSKVNHKFSSEYKFYENLDLNETIPFHIHRL